MIDIDIHELVKNENSSGDYSYTEEEYEEILESYTQFLKENMGPQD